MNCYFCQKNVKKIDYKDIRSLERFISKSYKIKAKKRTGVCSKHQRQLSKAIKRARQLGLLAYTVK